MAQRFSEEEFPQAQRDFLLEHGMIGLKTAQGEQ